LAGDWDDAGLVQADDLDQLVHAARLLGADGSLALGGVGAASVKGTVTDVTGEPVDVLWVTGRDADLAATGRAGLAPLRLERLTVLAGLTALDDDRLAAELRAASLDPGAPTPSPAAVLHAVLPYRYVLQTPAAAVLALTATPGGADLVAEVYGDEVVVVPHAEDGLALARACAERWRAQHHEGTRGVVLAHRGLCTFAHDARTAHANHVELVERARARLEAAGAVVAPPPPAVPAPAPPGHLDAGGDAVADALGGDLDAFGAGDPTAFGAGAGVPGGATPEGPAPGIDPAPPAGDAGAIAALRRAVSLAVGHPVVLRASDGEAARRLARREDGAALVAAGPPTPEVVRHVGPAPLVGRDVDAYLRAREAERARHGAGAAERPPDPHGAAPRVVVDPELGVLAAGDGPAEAARTLEVFEHVLWIAERAAALGGYVPPPEAALAVAAARAADPAAPDPHRTGRLAGRVALVTGAGSALGGATVRALVDAGAAVVGLDADADLPEPDGGPAYVGVPGDPADAAAVEAAVDRAVRSFGGLDVLVVGAGAPVSDDPVTALSPAAWRRALDGGAGGALAALQAAHPFLRLAPAGAAVVVVAPASGAGPAGAAAADALARLARAAAREWAGDGIRVNVVEPGPVAEGGPGGAAPAGAAAIAGVRGAEVSPAEVAATVVALCGSDLGRTTGARIPVGGDALPV